MINRSFAAFARLTASATTLPEDGPVDRGAPISNQSRAELYILGVIGIAVTAEAMHLVRIADDTRDRGPGRAVRAHVAARFADIIEVRP